MLLSAGEWNEFFACDLHVLLPRQAKVSRRFFSTCVAFADANLSIKAPIVHSVERVSRWKLRDFHLRFSNRISYRGPFFIDNLDEFYINLPLCVIILKQKRAASRFRAIHFVKITIERVIAIRNSRRAIWKSCRHRVLCPRSISAFVSLRFSRGLHDFTVSG